jgi:hypothetical protein
MLQRFHATGRDYCWEFLDPLSDGSIGYARFRFSYASLLPEAAGHPVLFEGMSCFHFRDALIALTAKHSIAASLSSSSTFRPSASNACWRKPRRHRTGSPTPAGTWTGFPPNDRHLS